LFYLQPDAMGTPRVVIDPTRDVAVWRWDLAGEAFGESAPTEDPDGDGIAFLLDLRFPGQRYDAATGLHYNYHRDYDPTVGRYVQSDPIGLNGGLSTYGYGEGAPLVVSDPLGLQGKGLGGMIGRMIARPMVQRMGGGLLAKAASQAAKARAHARRAAELAQRMQGIWGRIARGGRRGTEEVPLGCVSEHNLHEARNAASFARYKEILAVSEKANPLVDSLRETGQLPSNFVTKQQAIAAGWKPGKALENYIPGGQIGGDVFQNSTGTLPSAPGRVWYEADIGLTGTMSRGNQPGSRLLYSNDRRFYITADHYNTVHPFGGP
jgi:filamentous hemagglutinin